MSMNKIMRSCHPMKACLGLTLVLAAMMAVVSAAPILGIQMVEPTDYWAPVDAYSASATVTTVVEATTGSTSIQCTGRCTYRAVYNGTILWVYGKGFTPYEVIEFRINEVYLGRSDNADANGDVATWFKRSIPSGTYELYAHEAHTGKNSTRLTFVVTTVEPQTTIKSPNSAGSPATPSANVQPSGTVVGDYSAAGVVGAIIAGVIVTVILVRRRTTSNEAK